MSLRGPWAASRLASALAICKRVRARLIVAKLDRLSRNVSFISALLDSGVEFVAADNEHSTQFCISAHSQRYQLSLDASTVTLSSRSSSAWVLRLNLLAPPQAGSRQ